MWQGIQNYGRAFGPWWLNYSAWDEEAKLTVLAADILDFYNLSHWDFKDCDEFLSFCRTSGFDRAILLAIKYDKRNKEE